MKCIVRTYDFLSLEPTWPLQDTISAFILFVVKRQEISIPDYIRFHRHPGFLSLRDRRRTHNRLLLHKVPRDNILDRVCNYLNALDHRDWIAHWTISGLVCLKLTDLQEVVKGWPFDLPEYRMLPIQPWTSIHCHEELALIGVGSRVIGHGYEASMVELESLVKFINEGSPTTVNRLTTSSCSSWITSLDHKAFNYSVKNGAIIVAFEAKL